MPAPVKASALPAGVIVFDRALPRRVRVARGPSTLEQALTAADDFTTAVAILESSLATPQGRDAAVCLFTPSAPTAQRFLNTLRAHRAGERSSRRLARRAAKLLVTILAGHAAPGRKPVRLADEARARLVAARAFWLAAVQVSWESCADGRGYIVAALGAVAATRGQTWSVAQRRDLGRRAVSPKTHPVDLANLLTAWECDAPVRHVRLALRRPTTDVAHA